MFDICYDTNGLTDKIFCRRSLRVDILFSRMGHRSKAGFKLRLSLLSGHFL